MYQASFLSHIMKCVMGFYYLKANDTVRNPYLVL